MAGTERAGQVRPDPTPLQCRAVPHAVPWTWEGSVLHVFFGVEYWDFGSVLDTCKKLKAGTEQNRPKSLLSLAKMCPPPGMLSPAHHDSHSRASRGGYGVGRA